MSLHLQLSLSLLSSVSKDHYGGLAKKIIVIRASRIFQVIWSLVHHFVDEKTKNLLVFGTASDYLDVLEDYVDLEMLPSAIYANGRGVGAVGLPKRIEGGRLPPEADTDYDLATEEDIDPPSSLLAKEWSTTSDDSVCTSATSVAVSRLCGGSFSNGLFGEDFSTQLVEQR